jgi:hypothetical protein
MATVSRWKAKTSLVELEKKGEGSIVPKLTSGNT